MTTLGKNENQPAHPEPPEVTLTVGGPATAPSSRPGVGLFGATALQFELPPYSGTATVDISDYFRPSSPIRPGESLSYAVFAEATRWATAPDHEWQVGVFSATGLALNVLFDDGRSLILEQVRDQHGVRYDPQSQGASKTLRVNQWNVKRVDLSIFAGTQIVATHLVIIGSNTDPIRGWIDGLAILPRAHVADRPSDWIRTTRGSHSSGELSRGNTFPAVALPNAASFLSPVTNASSSSWFYSFHADNREDGLPHMEAFALCHSPTPWLGDFGVFHFMPTRTLELDRAARGVPFSHSGETDRAHHYSVQLNDGTFVELAPTEHGGIADIHFTNKDRNDDAWVVFDQIDSAGQIDISLRHGGASIRGYSDYKAESAGESVRVFVAMELEAECDEVGKFDTTTRVDTSAWVRCRNVTGTSVVLRCATSLISAEQAQLNLSVELPPSSGLTQIAKRAQEIWDFQLATVSVIGATDDERTTLYSNLYRLFLYPNMTGEIGPDGRLVHRSLFENDRPVRDGDQAIGNGYWDTYRTTWPLYFLLDPRRSHRLLNGLLSQYVEGGWMARWAAPGYTDLMVGTSSDVIFADAALKGILGEQEEDAYDSAIKNATTVSGDDRFGRKGIAKGLYLNWIPDSVNEGLSWTMENSIADNALAIWSASLADRLGPSHPREAELRSNAIYFRGRSRCYRELFDSEAGFFRGRDSRGNFARDDDFDPRRWGGDYTETNAWGMSFSAPHDGFGLIELYGGEENARAKLKELSSTAETASSNFQGSYGRIIHEMVEARDMRMGMLALSNQPSHHLPYMHLAVGEPWRTQEIVADALDRLFLGSEIGQGYPGDEDNGEMSAWYVFSAMGLYPLIPGNPIYALTAPKFEQFEICPIGGNTIRIRALRTSPEDMYVERVTVNGRDHHEVYLEHSVLEAGCEIDFYLTSHPATWGADSRLPSASSANDGWVWEDLTSLPGWTSSDRYASAIAIDNDATTECEIDSGWWFESNASANLALYSVTCGANPAEGPTSWTVVWIDEAGTATEIDRQSDVIFRWPNQLRIFSVPAAGRGRIRFINTSPPAARIAQLEFLGTRAP